jgi:hypothetical protein
MKTDHVFNCNGQNIFLINYVKTRIALRKNQNIKSVKLHCNSTS